MSSSRLTPAESDATSDPSRSVRQTPDGRPCAGSISSARRDRPTTNAAHTPHPGVRPSLPTIGTRHGSPGSDSRPPHEAAMQRPRELAPFAIAEQPSAALRAARRCATPSPTSSPAGTHHRAACDTAEWSQATNPRPETIVEIIEVLRTDFAELPKTETVRRHTSSDASVALDRPRSSAALLEMIDVRGEQAVDREVGLGSLHVDFSNELGQCLAGVALSTTERAADISRPPGDRIASGIRAELPIVGVSLEAHTPSCHVRLASRYGTRMGQTAGCPKCPSRLWPSSCNTVQLGVRMVVMGGPVGCGQSACRARLTCQRGILRLISRGFDRRRRIGLRRRQSRMRAWAQPWSFVSGGGKTARL